METLPNPLMLSQLVTLCMGLALYYKWPGSGPPAITPIQSMAALTQTIPVNYEIGRIEDMLVAELNVISHADCSESSSWESLELLVRRKHQGRIPDELVDDIMPRIFVPGTIHNTDAYIDTKTSTEIQGIAYAHYIWFDFRVDEAASNYQLCLTISVLQLRTAEVLSEWIEEQHPQITGYVTNCAVGRWIWCTQQPITTMSTKRFPVYRHIQLSLEQQEHLQTYLRHKALYAAKEIKHTVLYLQIK